MIAMRCQDCGLFHEGDITVHITLCSRCGKDVVHHGGTKHFDSLIICTACRDSMVSEVLHRNARLVL